MLYAQAKYLADKYAGLIKPGCLRLEVVGSVKRDDSLDVHDIEFLVIADEKAPRPEFGQKVIFKTKLDQVLHELCEQELLLFVKGKDKLKQFEILEAETDEPFHLELWIVRPETWGIQNVIRTGPREFSHRFVTNKAYGGLLPDDCKYIRGETKIMRNGKVLELPEEADAIALMGLGWIEPNVRQNLAFPTQEGV